MLLLRSVALSLDGLFDFGRKFNANLAVMRPESWKFVGHSPKELSRFRDALLSSSSLGGKSTMKILKFGFSSSFIN